MKIWFTTKVGSNKVITTLTVLGWYADEENIKKEMDEIADAINKGIPVYELKYAVKVKNKMLRVKIDED